MLDPTGDISVPSRPAAEAAQIPPDVRLFRVRVDRVRDEMAKLGADELTLATWGKMSPGLVHAVLTNGLANRATLRRLKRAIRWAWSDKVGAPEDTRHWARVHMKFLSPDIDS
jgi:hypothetical protein